MRTAMLKAIQFEVLPAVLGNPEATIIGDLVMGRGISPESFECMMRSQKLPFIYDVQGAAAFPETGRRCARYSLRD